MLFEDKKPYVVAGLVASLTLGANLAGVPTVALAEELEVPAEPAAAEQVEASGVEAASVEEAPAEVAPVAETPEASEVVDAPEAVDAAKVDEAIETPKAVQTTDAEQATDAANATTPADTTASTEVVTPSIAPTTDSMLAGEVANVAKAATTDASAPDAADTAAAEEQLALDAVTNQWKNENGKWYYYNEKGQKATGWVVTSKNYATNSGTELQRYWVDSSFGLFFNKLFNDGGYWAYATDKGYVVRGKYTASNGNIYLANNDGKLENVGWLVTGTYDGGGLQRYYINAETHSAVQGYSTDGGYAHYTTNKGYVLRGKLKVGNKIYLANNDGKLENAGWLVTGNYDGGGLQRYYINAEAHAAVEGYSTEGGYAHYTTGNGYVLRGKLKVGNKIYLANNDGKLENAGWLVTSRYDGGGLYRYYINADAHAAVEGYSTDGGYAHYTTSQGYVLINSSQKVSDGIILADNDGKLYNGEGWLVSGTYAGGLRRYYMVASTAHAGEYTVAKTGFFEAKLENSSKTQKFYGETSKGYVSWYKLKTDAGVMVSNSDGVLLESFYPSTTGWLVTGIFDGGTLQRYYIIDNGGHKYARMGAFTVDGNKYYGREDQGYVVRGSYTAPNGKNYYGNNDGVLIDYGWYKDSGGWYFLYADGSRAYFTNAAKRAWDKVVGGKHTSPTNYFICVDKSNFRVVILKKFNGSWIPAKNCDWLCAIGSKRNPTAEGFQRIISKGYSMSVDGLVYEYYWTQFNKPSKWRDNGQRFHSLCYLNGRVWSDGRGTACSNGCIRLTKNQAWTIYHYCPNNTTVWIYK